jgi:hypothetical protein
MEVRRERICGGSVPGGSSNAGGGAFSLFVDWEEPVLFWLAVSATLDGSCDCSSGEEGIG